MIECTEKPWIWLPLGRQAPAPSPLRATLGSFKERHLTGTRPFPDVFDVDRHSEHAERVCKSRDIADREAVPGKAGKRVLPGVCSRLKLD